MSHKQHSKLGQFFATAICGNDILSSALYVSGIAIIFSGMYAPIALFAVAVVLFFYRAVYREVVEALPINGGAYNALLNSTAKIFAAVAGVMTVLSYIATAVISAKTAVEYFAKFLEQLFQQFNIGITAETIHPWIIPAVILILFLFALLVIMGVSESAKVAAGIFSFHVFTLTSFVLIGLFAIFTHGFGVAEINMNATNVLVQQQGGLLTTLFLAFSASLLGVSGFESSANFVEEQKKGVFSKTLRNMTIGVMVFNPLIAYVILNVLPMPQIAIAKDFVLAEVATSLGGLFLLGWVAINAFFVLCGAVLTSYVGVTGLILRMSLDNCLPTFLLKKNSRGTYSRIIVFFFILCASILLVTKGNLLSLAGVYTISFLSVMTLFAIGNLVLRQTRPDLKRSYKAPIVFVCIAACATAAGIIGNIILDHKNVVYFLTYFIPSVLLTSFIVYKKDAMGSLVRMTRFSKTLSNVFLKRYKRFASDQVYVFIHQNKSVAHILEYIHRNESAHKITLVHCDVGNPHCALELEYVMKTLKLAGFYEHFQIRVLCLNQAFSPALLDSFAKSHKIQKNKIFMGSIHESHDFTYDELGGARIVW